MPSSVDTRELTERYVELTLGRSPADAVQLVVEPLVDGQLDLATLFDDVITPAAERIGELWYESKISVAEEHFATQLNQQVIATAVALSGRRTTGGRNIVLACPDGEVHDTGLRMVAALLTAHGHAVHMLGASTPTKDLVRYVQTVGATHVGLSIVTPLGIPGAIRAAEAIRESSDAQLIAGGRALVHYPNIGEVLGAVACGSTLGSLELLA